MAKKLKTGDVKRFKVELDPLTMHVKKLHNWAIIRHAGYIAGRSTRYRARESRKPGERIARILSIGPKYVTVRISK